MNSYLIIYSYRLSSSHGRRQYQEPSTRKIIKKCTKNEFPWSPKPNSMLTSKVLQKWRGLWPRVERKIVTRIHLRFQIFPWNWRQILANNNCDKVSVIRIINKIEFEYILVRNST